MRQLLRKWIKTRLTSPQWSIPFGIVLKDEAFYEKDKHIFNMVLLLYLYNPAEKSPLMFARFSLLSVSQINAAETLLAKSPVKRGFAFSAEFCNVLIQEKETAEFPGPSSCKWKLYM